ncbi:hypothetical protein QCA50_007371 [Cerrena zonata]|uniref:Prenylcysteine lyase domain-containing protein n=1 Tax=Cerrena zonata TaxID=2478898 RepID=A0AAW0GD37_9APHY
MYAIQILALVGAAQALQLPSWLPFGHSKPTDSQASLALPSPESVNRIAVIGAGAGGSSAAFWIAKAKERFPELADVQIDVYEKTDKIGGRSTVVYPYDDLSYEPVEQGASIFVKANKNLWRATEEFGLQKTDFEDEDGSMGVWDGEQFVMITSGGRFGRWWDTAKVLWRYGWNAPTKTQALVTNMINKFLSLYSWEYSSPFHNMTEVINDMEWTPYVSQTTSEFFDLQGVYKLWTREMIEGATRVNYGQDVDKIHALEGLCSLAANGASSVKGGNYQLFEEFVKRSNATVRLNTTVTEISRDDKSSLWTVSSESGSSIFGPSRTSQSYRAIIFAAPFHQANIKLSSPSALLEIPQQPYVNLHVTLLSTTSPQANPEYFGLAGDASVPSMVLTSYENARNGGKEPEFNSLSYHGKIVKKAKEVEEPAPETENVETENQKEEWVVKIFSKVEVGDAWLRNIFGEVGWVNRRVFQAYPVLPPTTSFPPIKLAQGLYYVNAFEPLISTMETETISARNVVQLLLSETYNAGICKHTEGEEGPQEQKEDFIYGWDC